MVSLTCRYSCCLNVLKTDRARRILFVVTLALRVAGRNDKTMFCVFLHYFSMIRNYHALAGFLYCPTVLLPDIPSSMSSKSIADINKVKSNICSKPRGTKERKDCFLFLFADGSPRRQLPELPSHFLFCDIR